MHMNIEKNDMNQLIRDVEQIVKSIMDYQVSLPDVVPLLEKIQKNELTNEDKNKLCRYLTEVQTHLNQSSDFTNYPTIHEKLVFLFFSSPHASSAAVVQLKSRLEEMNFPQQKLHN